MGETADKEAEISDDGQAEIASASSDNDSDISEVSEQHRNADVNSLLPEGNEEDDSTQKAPVQNADEDDSDMNPYEKALKDNENHKKRFVEELKREAEERKK